MVVEYYCYKETVGKKACSKICTDCSNHLTAEKNKKFKIMREFTKKDLRITMQKWRQEIWEKKQIPIALICGNTDDSLSIIASVNCPLEDLKDILQRMLNDLNSGDITKTIS